MKLKFTGFFLLLGIVLKAQLLSWTPEFFGDNANITITMDASLGNRGLFGHTASDVYVHTGVITSASTTPSDWKYVKFNQNFTTPNPSLQATSLGNNRWSFTINNIRAYYGVPANEAILRISILFRSGNGTRVQRNGDGSDMYITVLANPTQQAIRITNPFREPRYIPFTPAVCRSVGEQITLEARSSVTSQLRLIYNGNVVASTNGTSVSANTTIATAGSQQIIAESVIAGVTPTFTFNGNGAWTNPANWVGGNLPPATIPSGTEIIINPAQGGSCIIDVNSSAITFAQGSKLTVANGANLVINGNLNVPQQSEFTGGSSIVRDTVEFFVAAATPVAPLPVGVEQNGVTYSNNNTTATLVLYAPNKNNIVAVGDFNDWKPTLAHQMNRTPDGLRYWVTIDGLTPGEEYAYQYIIDCNLIVADYNSEKILDPWNDTQISAQTYPNLKAYPTGKASDLVSVLEPGKPQYNWANNNFVRPDKGNLICYELLIRDYSTPANFQSIINAVPELHALGINCLKLMPITEFENNNSWGYNPSFMFAVDKAYGTENKLRELIDSCHGRGIAVVLDMVLNHQFGQSPMVRMYWDAANNKPATNSPWFNPDARHPFNVGFDMNHEAPATIEFTERVMDHWLSKFRFDGFRWDLSKGFTQVNNPNDVGAWSAYDQSRVNIWDRIYNQSQAISPNCYMILEHLGSDAEEAELAKKGMLLWAKMTNEYNQASMGFLSQSNFDRAFHTTRWSAFGANNIPHLLAYAESHDEERLFYRNRRYGNQLFNPPFIHDTREIGTAARRMQAVAAFLFTTPGPKMIWQFGEYGYDASINMCENLTTPQTGDACRLSIKPIITQMPIEWNRTTVPTNGFTFTNYKSNQVVNAGPTNSVNNPARNALRDMYSRILKLRTQTNNTYLSTFRTNDVSFNLGGHFKWQIIQSNNLRILVVGNFDVATQFGSVNFPTTGTWQLYAHNVEGSNFSGINGNLTSTIMNVTTNNQGFNLAAGTFLMFIDRIPAFASSISGFNADLAMGGAAQLNWETTGTGHIADFEVERSLNGLHYEVIAKEKVKAGASVETMNFSVTDTDREKIIGASNLYYRVRINDKTGNYYYSSTQHLRASLKLGGPNAQ